MVNKETIFQVLGTIPDPEMPISITDLGLIEHVHIDDTTIQVTVLPTFIGCFALPVIAKEIEQKLSELAGVSSVEVNFINDPPWSTDRISEAGKASLAEHGISVPEGSSPCHSSTEQSDVEIRTSAIPCPWCQSRKTTLTSPFGPTRCKSIYFCNACRQPFERMKKV
jgi:ring-1,2-phenylacetyl-CoA epoxidase subunit PaaD